MLKTQTNKALNIKTKKNEQNPHTQKKKPTKPIKESRKKPPHLILSFPLLPLKAGREVGYFGRIFSVFLGFYATANSVRKNKPENILDPDT